jgi:septum formation protein
MIENARGKRSGIKWILASASPRRKDILRRLGLRFAVNPSGIEEPARKQRETPAQYASRIASLKARKTAENRKSGIVISADTIVVLGNRILGKPDDKTDAAAMLKSLSGRWHEVISAICLIDCGSNLECCAYSRTRVHFRRISSAELDWLLQSGEYRDKAGAYGAQGNTSLFIDKIEGCFFNVVGFPIVAFGQLCRKIGIDLTLQIKPGQRDIT